MLTPLLFSIAVAQAQEVLLPHFTPAGFADIMAAEALEIKMLGELQLLNLPVVPPSVLEQEFPISSACAESAECPSALFTRDASRLLIVGRVEMAGPVFQIQVRIYSHTDPSPLQVLTEEVPEEGVDAFLRKAAQETSVIRDLLPKKEDPVVELPPVEPRPPPPPVKPPPPEPVAKQMDPRVKRLPRRLREDYMASPLASEDWMKAKRIRSQNVLVNLGFGVSFGDVTRVYNTRYGFYETDDHVINPYSSYQYDTFVADTGFNLSFGVGFAPLWWLETSINGGVILAGKELSTGWEKHDFEEPETLLDDDVVNYDPITAASGIIEPQIRFYLVPSGPVKPYLLTGAFIRIHDGYVVQDLETVDYANRPNGVHFGAEAGGGMVFDSVSPVSVFFEVPWVYLFNNFPYQSYEILPEFESTGMVLLPRQPLPTNQVLSIRAGVSLRFQ